MTSFKVGEIEYAYVEQWRTTLEGDGMEYHLSCLEMPVIKSPNMALVESLIGNTCVIARTAEEGLSDMRRKNEQLRR